MHDSCDRPEENFEDLNGTSVFIASEDASSQDKIPLVQCPVAFFLRGALVPKNDFEQSCVSKNKCHEIITYSLVELRVSAGHERFLQRRATARSRWVTPNGEVENDD